MAQEKKYIAVDLGAESGRVMLGSVSDPPPRPASEDAGAGRKLTLEEIHRFDNGPIEENSSRLGEGDAETPEGIKTPSRSRTLRWDFNRLLSEVKTGISAAVKAAVDSAIPDGSTQIRGIGVDSWGVDFGLIDADGKLVENPYHYRDGRTNGMMEKAFEIMSKPRETDLNKQSCKTSDESNISRGKREIYENTGLQFMQLNSIYQLLAMRLTNSTALAKAKNLIFMADLFSYHLCGKVFAEYTLASTSQFMDMKTGQWSKEVLDRLSLPIDIMPKIVQPGTVVGQLAAKVGNEIGFGPIAVIAVGSHDTASAVAAVPADGGGNWAYLSSGTWSLMGVEVPKAIVNDKTFEYEFTNEGGVESTIRLLRNIMGLWLMQECKRQWQHEGIDLSYPELSAMAEKAEPFAGYINVDNSTFLAPGDMPKRINDQLVETGQKATDDKGQMIRTILESLAFKYRSVMEAIEDITGKDIEVLHIVGGGIQNELLCQFTANATGKKVITGPIEATASGNILMQAKATGQIKSLAELREIVHNSFELKEYQPQETSFWEEEYKKVRSKSFRSP